MRIQKIAAVPTLLALVLGLAACGQQQQQQAEYQAVCVDRMTDEAFDEDDQCDPNDDDYEGHGAWYFVGSGYHKKHKSHFKPGHKVSGGSHIAPVGHAVKYQGSKKVSVYNSGKQAGSPIKYNQDARKSTTVRGGENGGSFSRPKANSNRSRR